MPKNYTEGVKWIRMAAEQGNAVGQYNLGVTYANKFDYEEAVKWFRKAAAQGNADAKEWFRRSGFEE
ncbi:tetratricopeptide repeat protein [bacterium]|nr:tetratricopeptide repeat protein [bacterium]